jgi:inhibitor of KinA sporulation pathway (predicted exonuclease)
MRFVVIDFEATCDEPYNADPQEIIEFPAVVVDPGGASDGTEFHTYVRPVAHPRLPAFCTRLTGIGQEQVSAGPPFPEVLKQFGDWWRSVAGANALAVTCGDWDLGSLLPRQCAQHRLAIPAWADRWANLKRLFAWNYPRASDRVPLTEIASVLDVPLTGRLHSGIDDARNIARVLRKMIESGVEVEHTAYWRCSGCGTENSARDRACSRCGRSGVSLKPGDWQCPGCGCGNFSKRDRCFDCGIRRPDGGSGAPAKAGDWHCSACGGHNFARRAECFKCGRQR